MSPRIHRVLLVDDDPHHVALTKKILARSGTYETVASADTGPAAVMLARQLQPDIVLLDVRLGDHRGDDAIAALITAAPAAMIVMVSGLPPDQYRDRAMSLGAFACLDKTEALRPIDRLPDLLDKLHERFERALDGLEVVAPVPLATL